MVGVQLLVAHPPDHVPHSSLEHDIQTPGRQSATRSSFLTLSIIIPGSQIRTDHWTPPCQRR
jgi:hypothetical protein